MGKKRGGAEEHENAERWLLTYADMITLLLALFIYLYSISTINEVKLQAFGQAFASLFGVGKIPLNMSAGASGVLSIPGNQKGKADEKDPQKKKYDKKSEMEKQKAREQKAAENKRNMEALKEQLKQEYPDLVNQGKLTILEQDEGLMLRLQDSALFDLGSSDIASLARPLLQRMGELIASLPNPVRVEGHTDDLPIRSARYRSNFELSGARASSVVDNFIREGKMLPDRFSIAGYGEYKPIATNVPNQGNPLNRRVEILILEVKPKDEFVSEEAARRNAAEAPPPPDASAPVDLSPLAPAPGLTPVQPNAPTHAPPSS